MGQRTLKGAKNAGFRPGNALAAGRALAAEARDYGILDLIHESVISYDLDHRVTYWNAGAERLYGWTRQEVIGRRAEVVLEWAPAVFSEEILERLFAAGRWHGEFERRTKSGSAILVEVNLALRRNAAGEPVEIIATSKDISQRSRAVEELARSEAMYRNLFDHLPIAVIQTDTSALLEEFARLRAEGVTDLNAYIDEHPDFPMRAASLVRVTQINPEAVKLFGPEAAADFMGNVARFFRADQGTLRRHLLARWMGEESMTDEMRTVTFDGRTIDVVYKNNFSRALSAMGIGLNGMIDISRRVEAEEKLRQVRAEFAHAARIATLGELTGSIAHEINQPLTAITASGEAALRWLDKQSPDVEEAQDLIERMVVQARRAGDIIARIRDMASGKPPVCEPTSLNELVEEVLSFLLHELRMRDVQPRLELARDLPDVIVDATQLKQVLLNLILNALQAIEQHSNPERFLVVRTQGSADHVRVEVENDGPPIPQEVLLRLFESFFTTKPDGLGIGLSICQSIIEAHGGTIDCIPRTKGACFSFTLPVEVQGERAVSPQIKAP